MALIAGIVVATMPAFACSDGSPDGPVGGPVGVASQVQIADSEGGTTTLAELAVTPLVVNMWATWCKPCVKEMPDFDSVAAGTRGVRIVGVNVGDEPADASAFAARLGVAYEQYTDADGALSDAFEVSGLPSTAFIGADGAVLEVVQGALSAASLRAKIAEHFPEAVMEDES